MEDDRDRRVRERAHMIWEREGRPEGRDSEHWTQAEREIANEEAAAEAAAGELKVTAYNDPTRPGGPVEGGSYPSGSRGGKR